MSGNKWRRKPVMGSCRHKTKQGKSCNSVDKELQPRRPQRLKRQELEQLHPPSSKLLERAKDKEL